MSEREEGSTGRSAAGGAPPALTVAVPAAVPARCAACGYPLEAATCPRCGGRVASPRSGAPARIGPRGPVRDLLDGFVSLVAGAVSLVHGREYVGKLWLPILVNLAVLLAVVLGGFVGLQHLFGSLLAEDLGWFEFLRGTAGVVTGIAAFVLAVVATWLLAPVLIETITSPFLEPIAEATECAWAGRPMPAVDTGFWSSTLAGIRGSARILLVQLALALPLLLLSLTGIGALLAAAIAGWLNALVWFDIPCARRGYSLAERRALLRRNWARALGFGLAFQLGMLVPVFNVVLLTPAAAVAVSALYLRFDKAPRAGAVLRS